MDQEYNTYYNTFIQEYLEWAEYGHALANIFVVWIIQSEANC